MRYEELLLQLKQGKINSFYLFAGEEDYLKEEALKKIQEILLDPSTRSFNYELVYGEEIDGVTILNKALTLPILAQRRMVVVKDTDKLKKADKELLLSQYLEDPPSFTCLIFITSKVDLRERFFSFFNKKGALVTFNFLYEDQVARWIRNRVREAGKKISEGALARLQENAGNNLQEIANELDKIFIYLGERILIKEEDIDSLVSDSKANTIFDLTKAVGDGDRQRALRILSQLIYQGEEPLRILAMIVRQFRLIWRAKLLSLKGALPHDIATALHLNPYFMGELIEQTHKWSFEKLAQNHGRLLKADLEIKRGTITPKLALELLLLDLC